MTKHRVLITGIEGFVGQYLTRYLLDSGHEVFGVHLAPCTRELKVELHRGDIRDAEWLKSVLCSAQPDRVIHLAALSSVASCEADPVAACESNALGTLKLLEALSQLGSPARILVISSAAVYEPREGGGPLDEDAPLRPINVYGLSKLAAEEVARFYYRAHRLGVVVLRPFSHTGPGQNPKFIFPSVASRIVEIERAIVRNRDSRESGIGTSDRVIELGNLDIRHDYTDVRDMVRAYALALDRCQSGETYNVASGRTILLRQAVETLLGFSSVPIAYRSSAAKRRQRDLPLLAGSSTRFRSATGWQPEIPFETTLRDLLEYHRSH